MRLKKPLHRGGKCWINWLSPSYNYQGSEFVLIEQMKRRKQEDIGIDYGRPKSTFFYGTIVKIIKWEITIDLRRQKQLCCHQPRSNLLTRKVLGL